MKTTLITGGLGFIGSTICEELLQKKYTKWWKIVRNSGKNCYIWWKVWVLRKSMCDFVKIRYQVKFFPKLMMKQVFKL